MEELADPFWGADFSWVTEKLFAQEYRGPMQAPWGDLVLYTSDDLETIRSHPAASHQTVEALTGHWDGVPHAPSRLIKMLADSTFTLRDPQHRPEKLLVSRTLAPKALAGLRPVFGAALRQAVDEAVGRGEIDFRNDVVLPALAAFWGDGLGMTEDETALAFAAAEKVALGLTLIDPTPAQCEECQEGSVAFDELLMRVFRRSGEHGGFPLVDALLEFHARGGGDQVLTDPYMRLATSVFDGFNTLPNLLTTFAYVAAHHGVDVAAGGADPQQFASAFFLEATRLHSSVTFIARQATEEFVLGDVRVPEGANIITLWLFGNLDPRYFSEPDRFELQRPNRARQYSFGGGPYVCAGRNVVQATAEVMMAELAQEAIHIELTRVPSWVPGSAMHELQGLKVSLTRR